MAAPRLVLPARLSVEEALSELERAGISGAPVIDEARRFEGTVARAGLASGAGHNRSLDELADPGAQTVPVSSHLDLALEALTEASLSWVPVLDGDRRVVGTLSLSDLMRAYRRELLASVARLSDLVPGSAGLEVKIAADSPVAGKTLRAAGLPKGVIVTSITRGGEVVLPSGDTVIMVGDRLSLLGDRRGVEGIGEVAPLGGATPTR
jgi:trk system potassium uptake protein TrkA